MSTQFVGSKVGQQSGIPSQLKKKKKWHRGAEIRTDDASAVDEKRKIFLFQHDGCIFRRIIDGFSDGWTHGLAASTNPSTQSSIKYLIFRPKIN